MSFLLYSTIVFFLIASFFYRAAKYYDQAYPFQYAFYGIVCAFTSYLVIDYILDEVSIFDSLSRGLKYSIALLLSALLTYLYYRKLVAEIKLNFQKENNKIDEIGKE